MNYVALVLALLCVFMVHGGVASEFSQHALESSTYFENRVQQDYEENASLASSLGVAGVHGVDFSVGLSTSTLKCIRDKGYSKFAVPRGYRSYGVVDPNILNNLKNSWAAGFSNVDVYMFPCPKCGNGAKQVQTLVSYLRQNKAKFGMLWLDIEGSQYWGSKSSNEAFFKSLLAGAKQAKVHLGIYSSASQWTSIFSAGFNAGAGYPLWYAHYDHRDNFSDFKPFAGWSKPAIKQYAGTTTICGGPFVDLCVY